MFHPTSPLGRGRIATLLLAPLAFATGRAQPMPPAQLAPYVTTATRTPAEWQALGTHVEVISSAELARRQAPSLAAALGGSAAVPLFASGAAGATTSLFLRGANSHQTLFLVDGIRLNDPNTDYAVFLGGACVSACDSLEIAHGPQSTLYGGEAMGGVIALRAERGAGAPSGRATLEAGSFGTVQGAIAAQGERGATAYNVSAQGGRTENDRPNNAFRSAHTTWRVDRTLGTRASVGGTLRWFHGVYGDPGDRFTNDPDNESREENVLATAFGDFAPAPHWHLRTVLGGQNRRFVSENPRPDGGAQVTVVKNRRGVLDAQSTFTGFARHRWTAGVTAEANHARNTGFGDINEKQTLLALFAQDEFSPAENVFLTAGLRNDDFDTFGRATTGRGTAAWRLHPALKVRGSYGSAFRSPSFLDLHGASAFYRGNPGLRPEKARGWDAGVDFRAPSGRVSLAATWFDMRFTDLIASTANFQSVENIQRARTRGAELSGQAAIGRGGLRLAYTWLEADNLTSGLRLLRRPRHRASTDGWWQLGPRVNAGLGAVFTAQREDVHARTFSRMDGEDYVVLRAYGAWTLTDAFAVKLRLENLLDERYEEVHGYPATGFGAFCAAEWRW